MIEYQIVTANWMEMTWIEIAAHMYTKMFIGFAETKTQTHDLLNVNETVAVVVLFITCYCRLILLKIRNHCGVKSHENTHICTQKER